MKKGSWGVRKTVKGKEGEKKKQKLLMCACRGDTVEWMEEKVVVMVVVVIINKSRGGDILWQ